MRHKNFSEWNKKIEKLQQKVSNTYFYEREIWWASVGMNVGDEEDGKGDNYARPVLIVRKFNKNLFLWIAIIFDRKAREILLRG